MKRDEVLLFAPPPLKIDNPDVILAKSPRYRPLPLKHTSTRGNLKMIIPPLTYKKILPTNLDAQFKILGE
jgi:hypothetical protein